MIWIRKLFQCSQKNQISGGKINNITYCEKSSVIYLLSAFRFLLTAEYWTSAAPQSNILLSTKIFRLITNIWLQTFHNKCYTYYKFYLVSYRNIHTSENGVQQLNNCYSTAVQPSNNNYSMADHNIWNPSKIWGHLDLWILKIRPLVQKLGIFH